MPRKVEALRDRLVQRVSASDKYTALATRATAPSAAVMLMGLGKAYPQRVMLPFSNSEWASMMGQSPVIQVHAQTDKTWVLVSGKLLVVRHSHPVASEAASWGASQGAAAGSSSPTPPRGGASLAPGSRAVILRCLRNRCIVSLSAPQRPGRVLALSDNGNVWEVKETATKDAAGTDLHHSQALGAPSTPPSKRWSALSTSPSSASAAMIVPGGGAPKYSPPSPAGSLSGTSLSPGQASEMHRGPLQEADGDFQVVSSRTSPAAAATDDAYTEVFTARRLDGIRRAIAVAAGSHHGLAIVGIAVPPSLPAARCQGVPSLRWLCETAAQQMVDLSNVASCLAFTEAVPGTSRLRSFSIEYLFRNLDTALALGQCADLSEQTWLELQGRLHLQLRAQGGKVSPSRLFPYAQAQQLEDTVAEDTGDKLPSSDEDECSFAADDGDRSARSHSHRRDRQRSVDEASLDDTWEEAGAGDFDVSQFHMELEADSENLLQDLSGHMAECDPPAESAPNQNAPVLRKLRKKLQHICRLEQQQAAAAECDALEQSRTGPLNESQRQKLDSKPLLLAQLDELGEDSRAIYLEIQAAQATSARTNSDAGASAQDDGQSQMPEPSQHASDTPPQTEVGCDVKSCANVNETADGLLMLALDEDVDDLLSVPMATNKKKHRPRKSGGRRALDVDLSTHRREDNDMCKNKTLQPQEARRAWGGLPQSEDKMQSSTAAGGAGVAPLDEIQQMEAVADSARKLHRAKGNQKKAGPWSRAVGQVAADGAPVRGEDAVVAATAAPLAGNAEGWRPAGGGIGRQNLVVEKQQQAGHLDDDLFWDLGGAALASTPTANRQQSRLDAEDKDRREKVGTSGRWAGTAVTPPENAFSLLDFAKATPRAGKKQKGRPAPSLSASPSWDNPLRAAISQSLPAAMPKGGQPSLASIQAEEEQRHGGRAARKTRKATILNSPDDAWRKEDIGGALSVDEIQRREHWEAEEQEALALIAAVYGKSAIESSSL